ncbi:carbohydrate ABC transporter permease [Streptomyces sp. NPDC051976]|uniref:carbohydrate ABC transporter permease n=1 Tax=Streptomyces sp. NPDC051976 TaxID=3154947 RepID=UPI00341950EF
MPATTTNPGHRTRPARPRRGLSLRPRHLGSALIWGLVITNLLLLVWMVLTSLRDTKSIFEHPVGWPSSPHWANYTTAWKTGGFGRGLVNSTVVSTTSAAAAVAVAAPAAYALARTRKRVGGPLTMLFALGVGIPGQLIVIPVYLAFAKTQDATHLKLLDSMQGLILVYTGLAIPFTVFLLTGYFVSLPLEIEEAAVIDGAGTVRTFIQVVLPLARSGLITAFTLAVLGAWNETLFSIILTTRAQTRTLPAALLSFIDQQQFQGSDWGGMFAGVIIVMLPVLALFVVLGQRLVSGMTVGAGK